MAKRIKQYRFYLILLILILIPLGVSGARPVVKLELWTNQRHMADLTKILVKEFNNTVGQEQGISIAVRIVGDDSSELFQEAQLKRRGPDLFSTNLNTGYADPYRSGVKIWFDDLPGFLEWKKSWPSWYWIEGVTTYQGKVVAIPAEVINSRLIYNRDLFRKIGRDPDQPPRSYQEVKQIAAAVTRELKGKAFGFAYCGAESWPVEWMPSQWAEANGEAAYWDWQKGRWAMKGYYRVFKLLLEMEQEGSMFPGTAYLTNEALRSQFAEGRIAMFMGEFWDVGVLNSQFTTKVDWGVAPIPTFDGKFHGKSRAMLLGGFWSINGQSRYKNQAWEFVKWFSSYQVRARLYEHGKSIDPDPLVAKYATRKPAMRGYQEFAATLDQDYLASYPVLPGWTAPFASPCTVYRLVLTQHWDLQEELNKLEDKWNNLLENYYRSASERRRKNEPLVQREWNIYPQFDRRSGDLGEPLLKPVFSNK